MPSTIHTPSRQSGLALTPPAVTLALWSLRRTWFLLVIIALGLISAMVVACTIPMYSMVTTTAGLRGILNTTVNTSEINLDVTPSAFSTLALQRSRDALDSLVQEHLGSYMSQSPSLMLTSESIRVLSPRLPAREYDLIQYAATFPQDGRHLQLVAGRFPNLKSNEYEIMLTPDTLAGIGLKLGSELTLTTSVMDNSLTNLAKHASSPQDIIAQVQHHKFELDIPARVVGTFKVPDGERAYWHQNDFTELTRDEGAKSVPVYQFLGSSDLLLKAYDRFTQAHNLTQVYPYTRFDYNAVMQFLTPVADTPLPDINWTYRVDPQKVDFTQYDAFSSQVAGLQADMTRLHGDLLSRHDRYFNPFDTYGNSGEASSLPYTTAMAMTSALFSSSDGPGTLEQYRNRLSVVQLPVAIISAQIIALILFFISMMLGLLVDRQRDTIAILRSRGASGRQVYTALLTQGLGLCVLALLLGPLLAMIAAYFLARSQLLASDLSSLLVLIQRPVEVLKLIAPYALIVALVSLLTLALSLRETASMDVLMTRRESSRTTRRGLVQRLHLDIVAALIALCGFAISLYLGGINNLLDARTQSLLATPLSLAAPLFLIIAAVLLFFRLYPLLLNLAARLAGQGRGAASMLALAQISRSPGQSARMILLLALALAFTVFTSVFTTTQNEHARNLASYESGADISGPLPSYDTYSPTLQEVRRDFVKLSGVTAFSAGFSGSGATSAASGTGPGILFQVRAVDADTFGSTAYWPDQRQLTTMMDQLRARRSTTDAIPAFVDQLAWEKLNLHVGSTFTISVSNLDISELHCVVLGKVEHIPTVNDSTQGGLDGDVPPSAGVLVDFQTYLKAYQQSEQAIGFTSGSKPLTLNQFWMRTTDDATQLANIRSALRLSLGSRYDQAVFDRRAIIDNLHADPLSLNLLGILAIGTIVALLLAVVGDLLASLLSVRPRLTNFAVLRALGTSPGQVASVLGWEQSLIYSVGVLLGLVAGVLLSLTLVPNLVFSGLPNTGILSTLSNSDFYALQQVISVRPVFPPTLIIAFVVLALVFFAALGLMVRAVSRPSMGQVLRLNQD